jgi:integrase
MKIKSIAPFFAPIMNTSFFLFKSKKSIKTGLIPVYVMVNYNGDCIRKPVKGVKVIESHWDNHKERVLPSLKNDDYNRHNEFNIEITEVQNRLNKLWSTHFVSKKHITKQDIIEAIDNNQNDTVREPEEELTLIKGFEMFIEQNKSHRSERTITGYGTTLNLFKAFKAHTKIDDRLSMIDLHFFDTLRNYCFDVREYKNNTFAKTINNLKTFMNWSEDRGYHQNYTFRKFTAPEEDIEVIFLTTSEFKSLSSHEFKSEKLAKAADVFLFSCATGLRYSDLANLKPSSIIDDEIHTNVTKTKKKNLIIPLNNFSRSILQKYKGTRYYPLPMVSSQNLNDYIKLACKEAGIDTLTTITRYSGNKKIEKTVPKYEVLSLHAGRKTFVTSSLVLGIQIHTVKAMTGHRSDSSFKKYVGVSDLEKRKQMNETWDKL